MPRILLDTTFILPSLGIEVGKEIIEGLEQLSRLDTQVFFSNFSIMESLWVAARLRKSSTFVETRFFEGLRSVLDGDVYQKLNEGFNEFSQAANLRALGHPDMIDNILYANSLVNGLKFLTVDSKLRTFIRLNGLKDTAVFPSEIKSLA